MKVNKQLILEYMDATGKERKGIKIKISPSLLNNNERFNTKNSSNSLPIIGASLAGAGLLATQIG